MIKILFSFQILLFYDLIMFKIHF